MIFLDFNSCTVLNLYKNTRNQLISQLITGNYDFANLALEVFRFQYAHNPIYQEFCQNLGIDNDEAISMMEDIPHLPISAFKNHALQTGVFDPVQVFLSSGTTETRRSQHLFQSMKMYDVISKRLFERFVVPLHQEVVMLALLPSYLSTGDSSLVYMAHHLMAECGRGAFYLHDFESLAHEILRAQMYDKQVVLLGVAYALLDFGEMYDVNLLGHTVIETGGMKGRRREMLRDELHVHLLEMFGTKPLSEYGMTELTSQFYTDDKGWFQQHDFARITIHQLNDPLSLEKDCKTGIVNIIDLGNIDSCAFIETQDLGRIMENGAFEILGRIEQSDVRGCSLLYQP